MSKVILDTDIGTDVDDALALAMLCGSPEVTLQAVTTVYGNTTLRAQLTRRLLRLAGGPPVPIYPGAEQTRSGKAVWWPGHEGALHDRLEEEPVNSPGGAATAFAEVSAASPAQVDVLAIGPLTNLADALDSDPGFPDRIDRVFIMGGDFRAGADPEHNILSDIAAAQRVLNSTLRIVIGGLDLTTTFRFSAEQVDAIRSAGALGTVLGAEIDQWWALNHATWSNPHDPIVALSLIEPRHFRIKEHEVRVLDDGRTVRGGGRRVSLIEDMDRAAVGNSIVSRIRTAGLST